MTLPRPPERVRRIVYLGTPQLAVEPLTALIEAGYDVPLVVSRADKRRGRGRATQPSPVKAAALDQGLSVTSNLADVADIDADLAVVVAFGRIIGVDLLNRLPMVNLHFSLLPRWRGAAPVERAILAGDATTGVCLMAVEEGLDTGGVYRRDAVPIGASDTVETLRSRLVTIGTSQLLDALDLGFGEAETQVGDVTYADKIMSADLLIDWNAAAEIIDRQVRVGGAHTMFRGRRLKIWRGAPLAEAVALDAGMVDGLRVATATGAYELIEVQPEGKAKMAAQAWRNGVRIEAGDRLGG